MKRLTHLFLSVVITLLSLHLVTLFASSPAYALSAPSPGRNLLYDSYVDGAGYPVAIEACRGGNSVYKECTTRSTNIEGYLSLVEDIAGCIEGLTCTPSQSTGYKNDMNRRSAMGGVTNYIAMMYTNPPASSGTFLADLGRNLGLIPPKAYAQGNGIGFSGLSPLLEIWKGFRNIAYVLLAITMVIIGFMVMLRKRIDPKTVMTVQNSLPRIVITLILITFSYAIVGLMIDIMYILIIGGISIIRMGFPDASVSIFGIEADLVNGGFLTLLFSVFAPLANMQAPIQAINGLIDAFKAGDAIDIVKQIGNNLITQLPQTTSQGIAGGVGVLTGPLFSLLLSLAYLFGFIRILFMLLSSYVQILIAVIFGPIQLLAEVFPGGHGFSSWMKNLINNLIPFPVTIFMLFLGNTLINNPLIQDLWQPPLLPKFGDAQVTGSFAVTLIWLGIIMVIPSVVGSIKEAMKQKPMVTAGGAFAPVTEAFQTGTGALSLFYYGKQLLPGKKRE